MLNIIWLCEYSSQNDFIGNLFQPGFSKPDLETSRIIIKKQQFIITLFKLIKMNPLYNTYKIIKM